MCSSPECRRAALCDGRLDRTMTRSRHVEIDHPWVLIRVGAKGNCPLGPVNPSRRSCLAVCELWLHMPLFSVSTNVVRMTNKNAATPPKGVTAECKNRAGHAICQPPIR